MNNAEMLSTRIELGSSLHFTQCLEDEFFIHVLGPMRRDSEVVSKKLDLLIFRRFTHNHVAEESIPEART